MTTPELSRQKCLNHGAREAVARCPSCRNFFCRECITEHEQRVVCTQCLQKLLAAAPAPKRRLRAPVTLLTAGAGAFCLWLVFVVLSRILLNIPSSFHEGALWLEGL